MENNVQGNQATQNPDSKSFSCRDWREARRAWRNEKREQRYLFPFHGLFVGLSLVLAGVLFLLNQTGTLTGDTWWQALLIGLGGIWIINGMLRYRYPAFQWGAHGKIITGIILILVGALLMAGVSEWWPTVLIVAGVLFLLRFIWPRQNVLP